MSTTDDLRFVFKAGPGDYRIRVLDMNRVWRELAGVFPTREAAQQYMKRFGIFDSEVRRSPAIKPLQLDGSVTK